MRIRPAGTEMFQTVAPDVALFSSELGGIAEIQVEVNLGNSGQVIFGSPEEVATYFRNLANSIEEKAAVVEMTGVFLSERIATSINGFDIDHPWNETYIAKLTQF